MIRGDWVFNYTEGELKLTTSVETPMGDTVLGFRIPDGTDITTLIGVVMSAEENALEKGQKFIVDTVVEPDVQVSANDVPANVMIMSEWKDKKNEQAAALQAR